MAAFLTGAALLGADGEGALPERERLAMWAFVLLAGAAGIAIGWFAGHRMPRRLKFSGLKVPLLQLGPTGKFARANATADALAKASGLADAQGLVPDDAAALAVACIKAGTATTHKWSAGNSWFEATLEPFDGGVQVLLSDITERHRLEEEVARVREESAANSRMTSEFVSNISHDIRVPMSGVIGLGKLLLETDLNPEQEELGRTLVESAENAVTLADELLDLAKIEAGKLEIDVRPMELGGIL